MGSISKKNADKNNTESTDNGKSAEEISDIQAYQTTLQNCANLAKKLDTKAAAVFKDDAAIASIFSQKIKQKGADGSKSEKDTGVDFSNLGYREGYHLNAQDSERKIAMFAQGLSQDQSLNPSPQQKKLKPSIKVTKTTFDTEMSPCNSCTQVVDEFKNSNKNVDTELSYGVGFVHENPKGTDEKSNFLKKNGDITDFLIN